MDFLSEDFLKEIRKLGKEFKTEIKELINEHDPDLGYTIEKFDRLFQSMRNPINGLKLTISPIDSICLGDHLCVKRDFYVHHGLYIGNREIMHYDGGIICVIGLEDFLLDSEWGIVDSPLTYDIETSISRGKTRIGEQNYDFIFNNCEHFVNWCRSGGKYSDSI